MLYRFTLSIFALSGALYWGEIPADEDVELNKIQLEVNRQKQVLDEISRCVECNGEDDLKVAILGNSCLSSGNNGFNEDVLAKLFRSITSQKPRAVFFIGNLVSGFLQGDHREHSQHLSSSRVNFEKEKNIFGESVRKGQGVHNPQIFSQQLAKFSEVLKNNLGEGIPFYPVAGEHEVLSAESLDVFRRHFSLPPNSLNDAQQLLYSVSLGNSLFVTISTDYYNVKQQKKMEAVVTHPVLDWLDATLQKQGKNHRYLFALGDDPAYSTKASFGYYTGLDQNTVVRDALWRVLIQNHVSAYFCADEILYDRSYRQGVWQIITGGAGAVDPLKDQNKTLFHYVLLKIPQDNEGELSLEVYNQDGLKIDNVALASAKGALYQLRIDKK